MSSKHCSEEFKIETMKQIVDRSYNVAEVAARLGMMTDSHYEWVRKHRPDSKQHQAKENEDTTIK